MIGRMTDGLLPQWDEVSMNRRGFLGGLFAPLVAPAIIRTPGVLMSIRPLLIGSAASSGLVGVDCGYMYSIELTDIIRAELRDWLTPRFQAATFYDRPFIS